MPLLKQPVNQEVISMIRVELERQGLTKVDPSSVYIKISADRIREYESSQKDDVAFDSFMEEEVGFSSGSSSKYYTDSKYAENLLRHQISEIIMGIAQDNMRVLIPYKQGCMKFYSEIEAKERADIMAQVNELSALIKAHKNFVASLDEIYNQCNSSPKAQAEIIKVRDSLHGAFEFKDLTTAERKDWMRSRLENVLKEVNFECLEPKSRNSLLQVILKLLAAVSIIKPELLNNNSDLVGCADSVRDIVENERASLR